MTRDEAHHAADHARYIRQVFGVVARRYDLLNHLLSAGLDHRWRQRAAALALPRRGRSSALADKPPAGHGTSRSRARVAPTRRTPSPLVVDVCAGTGDLAMAMLRRSPAVRVIACDFSRPMLLRAQRKFRRAGLAGRVGLLEADALDLPLADESADAITCAFGFRNLADPVRGLCEMIRVLRPGGRIIILEFHMPEGRGFVARAFSLYFRHILPRLGGWLSGGGGEGYRYLARSVEALGPTKTTAGAMCAAGFETVQTEPLPPYGPGRAGGIASVFAARKPA